LWIDLTHWDFAVYSNTFESLSAFFFPMAHHGLEESG
jgi:hypothetical protein